MQLEDGQGWSSSGTNPQPDPTRRAPCNGSHRPAGRRRRRMARKEPTRLSIPHLPSTHGTEAMAASESGLGAGWGVTQRRQGSPQHRCPPAGTRPATCPSLLAVTQERTARPPGRPGLSSWLPRAGELARNGAAGACPAPAPCHGHAAPRVGAEEQEAAVPRSILVGISRSSSAPPPGSWQGMEAAGDAQQHQTHSFFFSSLPPGGLSPAFPQRGAGMGRFGDIPVGVPRQSPWGPV